MRGLDMDAKTTDYPKAVEEALARTGMTLPTLALEIRMKERTLRSWREGTRKPLHETWERFQNAVNSISRG